MKSWRIHCISTPCEQVLSLMITGFCLKVRYIALFAPLSSMNPSYTSNIFLILNLFLSTITLHIILVTWLINLVDLSINHITHSFFGGILAKTDLSLSSGMYPSSKSYLQAKHSFLLQSFLLL